MPNEKQPQESDTKTALASSLGATTFVPQLQQVLLMVVCVCLLKFPTQGQIVSCIGHKKRDITLIKGPHCPLLARLSFSDGEKLAQLTRSPLWCSRLRAPAQSSRVPAAAAAAASCSVLEKRLFCVCPKQTEIPAQRNAKIQKVPAVPQVGGVILVDVLRAVAAQEKLDVGLPSQDSASQWKCDTSTRGD